MLSAIDKTNELDPSSFGVSTDHDAHRKNAFSFMNEHTDIQKMLSPNIDFQHQKQSTEEVHE